MKNNNYLKITLGELLEILDARGFINVFTKVGDRENSIKFIKVYEFISEPELMRKYSSYKVIGLNVAIGSTNILIEEA